MPTDIVTLLSGDKGTVRKAALVYPPTGSVTTNTSALLIERSFDSGTSQYAIRDLFTRFRPPVHPGATGYTYTFTVVVSAKDDADTRDLVIQEYPTYAGGGISSSLYDEDEPATGIIATVPIASLVLGSNTIVISGIGAGPYDSQRWSISGTTPTGKNALSISSIVQNAHYSLSATPGMLNIDGDASLGKIIDRGSAHTFGWATGQAGTAYELFYRIVGAGSFSSTGIVTTPNQFHVFAINFFASGNNYEWYVVEYDDESNASANSSQKTFTVVGTLTAPTISAPASVVSSALPSFASSGATHTKEKFEFLESGVVIYSSGELTQTSGSHTPVAGGFLNGNTHLEDGHSYTARVTYIAADGSRGSATAAFSVLFTPPNQPTATATSQDSFININYVNPAGGATVDSVDILYALAYDAIRHPAGYDPALNPSAAFANLVTDLSPSTDANYQWYESKHGQLYYFKVRAWSGMAFIDSEVVDATLALPAWIWIHDPAAPEDTILQFEGYVTAGGNESSMGRGWVPNAVSSLFLNSPLPSTDRDVTSAGVQVATETWRVTLLLLARNLEEQQKREDTEALLKRPASLCVRSKDAPTGLGAIGSISNVGLPVPISALMNKYSVSFDFTPTSYL